MLSNEEKDVLTRALLAYKYDIREAGLFIDVHGKLNTLDTVTNLLGTIESIILKINKME